MEDIDLNWLEEWLVNLSGTTMSTARLSQGANNDRTGHSGETTLSPNRKELSGGTAQSTYLLPRSIQRKAFLRNGYIEGKPGDYGLVSAAVGNQDIPIFQTRPDVIKRDQLIVIGNPHTSAGRKIEGKFGDSVMHLPIDPDAELYHAGDYPSALYIDSDYNVYRKSWDLNDYGNSSRRAGTEYSKYRQIGANLLDKIGNPVVVTTGFQKVLDYATTKKPVTLYDIYDTTPIAQEFIKSRGLVPYYETDNSVFPPKTRVTMFTLPEVTVTSKRKKK